MFLSRRLHTTGIARCIPSLASHGSIAFRSSAQATRLASSYIFNWGIGTDFQLGHEKFDTEDSYLSKAVYKQKLPRRLVNSGRIQQIAFGEGFTLGVTRESQLLAWGKEYPGRNAPLRTPTLIPTEFEVKQVAAGMVHCGALDSEGRVYLWGDNGSSMGGGGMLGTGGYEPAAAPVLVKSLVEAGVRVTAVSLGEQHSLFLSDDGAVYSCGTAEYGRLGHMDNWSTDELVPRRISDESFGGERVVQIAAGYSHSLALTESGRVYSWGRNDQGQLGLGDTFIDMHSMEASPRIVDSELLEDKSVAQIRAGRGLSGALTTNGELYHWGHKILHQPVKVTLPEDEAEGREEGVRQDPVTQFALSGQGSGMCTALLTQGGALYTVGPDSSSVLGRAWSEQGGLLATVKGLFGAGEDGPGNSSRVQTLEDRVVHEVYGGFGQQMAARVSGPVRKED